MQYVGVGHVNMMIVNQMTRQPLCSSLRSHKIYVQRVRKMSSFFFQMWLYVYALQLNLVWMMLGRFWTNGSNKALCIFKKFLTFKVQL